MRGLIFGGAAVLMLVAAGLGGGGFTSVPFATDQQLEQYAQVVKDMDLRLPVGALLGLDAVRFHQDFSQVTPTTMQETAGLFAMCIAPRSDDGHVVMDRGTSWEWPLTIHRPTSIDWTVSEASQEITVTLTGDGGKTYPNHSVLQAGHYRLVAVAPQPGAEYRMTISLALVSPCGPAEVEQVMDGLGFSADDKQMALNIMVTFMPPGQFFFQPLGGGQYLWPVESKWPITSPFGYRLDPVTGAWAYHTGVDIGADEWTDVHAAADGEVIFAGWDGNYGYAVRINHGGLVTVYGHLNAFDVHPGQHVAKGETIGAVGSTGKSTGPHLHFEWRIGDKPVDPLQAYR